MKHLAYFALWLVFPSALLADTVLLDFTSDHCPPCVQMEPLVRRLESEGLKVRTIDVRRNGQLAQQYRVRYTPTFVLLRDGKEAGRIVGSTSESALRRLVGSAPAKSRRAAPAGSRTAATAQTARERLEVTVRLTTNDRSSKSFATGTVIQSRAGETLILTCSHLFDGVRTTSTLVEFFADSPPSRQRGFLVTRDRKTDVALVRVPTERSYPVAAVAPVSFRPSRGMAATSAGCNHGDDPTVWSMKVVDVNRYLNSPTIECSSEPVQGRSGGGLFNQSGQIMGVCSAADPSLKRGIYSGLTAIHTLLQKQGLAQLYRNPPVQAETVLANNNIGPGAILQPIILQPVSLPSPQQIGLETGGSFQPASARSGKLVCVIEGREGKDRRVVVIDNPSDQLIKQLEQEQNPKETADVAAAQRTAPTRPIQHTSRPSQWRPIRR